MDLLFLSTVPLFQGLQPGEIKALLRCVDARERRCSRGEALLRAGDVTRSLGLVLSGSVNITVHFYWGGSHIFGRMGPGEIFAETYAVLPDRELMCDAVAAEDTCALFMDMAALTGLCDSACSFHRQVMRNLLGLFAEKNLALSRRMMHTASKSTRERLRSFLSEQAAVNGSPRFTIPFSRQQLADYLGVERSALSAELSRMQKDGLIRYRRNDFTLCGEASP